jgi:hypothetical protein
MIEMIDYHRVTKTRMGRGNYPPIAQIYADWGQATGVSPLPGHFLAAWRFYPPKSEKMH